MNIYFVHVENIKTPVDVIEGYYIYESMNLGEIIAAETRAKAKYEFMKVYSNDIEWIDVKTKILEKDIDSKAGILKDVGSELYWELWNKIFNKEKTNVREKIGNKS